MNISTVEDFLNFYPIRYLDKSKTYLIRDLKQEQSDVEIQLKGKISNLKEITYGKGRKRLTAKFHDQTGSIDLVWFQYSQWLKEQIPLFREVYIFGKINFFGQNLSVSMAHPEIELEENKTKEIRLRPIYPSSEKLTKRGLNQKFFQGILGIISKHTSELIEENLPEYLLKSLKLMKRSEAYLYSFP